MHHDGQYLDLMDKILREGEPRRNERTGVGTLSLFGERLSFDLQKGFPLLTTKLVHARSIIWELIWFLEGRTDNQWLNDHNVTIWDEWSTEEQCARFGRNPGDLGPVYGHLWRNFGGEYDEYDRGVGGVDQIARLLEGMAEDPQGRRHIVTGWDPRVADRVTLPPCHTFWQCYVRRGQYVDLQLTARSIDYFLGCPFNIASYSMLTHMIAWYLGLEPGRFTMVFGDVHIYMNTIEQCRLQLSRDGQQAPSPTFTFRGDPRQHPRLTGLDYEQFLIEDYDPMPAIKADVAV